MCEVARCECTKLRNALSLRLDNDSGSQSDLTALRVATASTTRRSAAIPYSILALVHGDKVLFTEACNLLLQVAENEGDRYTSLVQTHALNTLNVIILDARQSGFFPLVAEQTTTTALRKIASAQ